MRAEDMFLGSELVPQERDPETARFHVIPMPLEKTVSYGAGTAAGPKAILEASHELERLCKGVEPCKAGIVTLAAIDCSGSIDQALAALRRRTAETVRAGAIPVTLGGEHSLTWGAVTGIADVLDKPVGIVQIDAHADLRNAYQGEPHSHASVMHLLAEEGIRLAQFGVRALCAEEVASRDRNRIFFRDGEDLAVGNVFTVDLPPDFPDHVYVSFDVDGLDPSIMPATGTPVPGGLGYYQALHLVEHALKGRICVGFDVVELAPIKGQPAWDFTVAQIVYRLMAACG